MRDDNVSLIAGTVNLDTCSGPASACEYIRMIWGFKYKLVNSC